MAKDMAGVLTSCFSPNEPPAQALRKARADHPSPATHAQWAAFLVALVAVCSPLRGVLEGRGGFSTSTIDRAEALARALRGEMRPASSATEMRDRLVQVLAARVSMIRRQANYLFRHDPELRRLFQSEAERARRASKPGMPRASTNLPPEAPVNPPEHPENRGNTRRSAGAGAARSGAKEANFFAPRGESR